LKNYRLFIEAGIKQFVISQTQDCYCDWMQFGRIYNFNINAEEGTWFLYTPIAIENIFYRDGTSKYLKHLVKALLLEYYQTNGNTCEECKFYEKEKKYCKLHIIAKDAESWCYDFTTES